MRRARVLIPLLALLAAGCATPAGVTRPDHESITPDFHASHDHEDPALHGSGTGLEPVAYHALVPHAHDPTDATARGAWLNTELVIAGERAFIGYMGAPWLIGIVNLTEPTTPVLEGVVNATHGYAVDVAATPDGEWAIVSVQNGLLMGTQFTATYGAQTDPGDPGVPSTPGLAVVDARDPANPHVTSVLPMHGMGPHTAMVHTYPDGRTIVFANKAEFGSGGNGVLIAELESAPNGERTLRPLTFYTLDVANPLVFPHDVDVQTHPLTGQVLAYLAYWDAGLVILDVTDPVEPRLVSRHHAIPAGEELQLHDVHPAPRPVNVTAPWASDDANPTTRAPRHFVMTAPEIEKGSTTGHFRIIDITNPAEPHLAGSWHLPGDHVVDHPYVYTTHNFQFLPDGRVALAHAHAGLWILDWLGPGGFQDPDPEWIQNPRATAYAVPHVPDTIAPTWKPVAGTPWMWGTATDAHGTVWATDITSGLHGYGLATT